MPGDTTKTIYKTGTGEIDLQFGPEQETAFRLTYIRAHFTTYTPPTGGTASEEILSDFQLWVESAQGDVHNTHLFTYRNRGLAATPTTSPADVNLILGQRETAPPSGWTFQPGDKLRLKWSNDEDEYTEWGIEVGYTTS